jgi:hypothetical protein
VADRRWYPSGHRRRWLSRFSLTRWSTEPKAATVGRDSTHAKIEKVLRTPKKSDPRPTEWPRTGTELYYAKARDDSRPPRQIPAGS